MNPKLALVVIVLLAALFALSVGFGLTRGNRQAGAARPAWVEGLGNALALEEPLTAEHIGPASPAACRSQVIEKTIVLPAGSRCSFLVRESASRLPRVRAFTLALVSGGRVRVVIEQAEQVTLKETLDEETRERKYRVSQPGGMVQIQCASPITAAPCQVALSTEE